MFTHSTMNIGQLKWLIILIIMFGKDFHHSILNWTEQFSSIIKQIRIPSCNAELWLSGRRMLSKIIKLSQMLIRCLPHPRTENFFNSTFMDFKSSLPPLPIRIWKFSWRTSAFCVYFKFGYIKSQENQNSQILMETGILCGLQISELTFCYIALLIYSDRFLSCSMWSYLYETDTYHIAFSTSILSYLCK